MTKTSLENSHYIKHIKQGRFSRLPFVKALSKACLAVASLQALQARESEVFLVNKMEKIIFEKEKES